MFAAIRRRSQRHLALAIATITVVATISAIARADMVGAAAGAGSGLVVAGPVGAVAGGVVGPEDRKCPPRRPQIGSSVPAATVWSYDRSASPCITRQAIDRRASIRDVRFTPESGHC